MKVANGTPGVRSITKSKSQGCGNLRAVSWIFAPFRKKRENRSDFMLFSNGNKGQGCSGGHDIQFYKNMNLVSFFINDINGLL
jgi:hypothetical protein